MEAVCDLPAMFEKSPTDALEGAGWHRIYVEGGSAAPGPDGRFGMKEHRNQIAAGDHFLLSAGTLVEWTYSLLDAITGRVFVHIARVDEPGVVGRYELFVVHNGANIPMFSVDDSKEGVMGYVPYENCFAQGAAAVSPGAADHLLLRATNLSGGQLGIVISPPDYFTWLDIEVK